MSKYVHIKVSTRVSTEFYLEVDEDATDEEIANLADKEITLPHQYPRYLNKLLYDRFNMQVEGIDGLLHSWASDELKYLIDGRSYPTVEGE